MRSLIVAERRLTDRDDRGAVIVWVSIMMAVLLGFGALVIDVGALYAERRQLQNGADAAALAVAQDCAEKDNAECAQFQSIADTYADHNANDGAHDVDLVCGVRSTNPTVLIGPQPCTPPAGVDVSGVAGWVQVVTSTRNPSNTDNPDEVSFVLAPFLDNDDEELEGEGVAATAVAAWEAIGTATTSFPVAFSVCEFKALGGSLDGTDFPDLKGYIYTHGTDAPSIANGCDAKSNGQNLPGGFGWLSHDNECKVTVEVGTPTTGSDNGNNTECKDQLPTWQNTDVLVPLFDGKQGKDYIVVGFAGFTLRAYCLGGQEKWLPSPSPSGGWPKCSNDRWFYGEFTHFTATNAQPGTDGGTDFGGRVVTMVG
jgi:hypothetical protein